MPWIIRHVARISNCQMFSRWPQKIHNIGCAALQRYEMEWIGLESLVHAREYNTVLWLLRTETRTHDTRHTHTQYTCIRMYNMSAPGGAHTQQRTATILHCYCDRPTTQQNTLWRIYFFFIIQVQQANSSARTLCNPIIGNITYRISYMFFGYLAFQAGG